MNAYGVVAEFEKRVAEFSGARFGVAVDCCTSAIFLSCLYLEVEKVICPARTYISVPMAIIHSGGEVEFGDLDWRGVYQLKPYPLYDGAKRFRRAMYRGGFHCLSFHSKKILNIGRGGMILTDDEKAVEWFRKARYDGREGKPYAQERVAMLGYHCYMTPEQAARGLTLLDTIDPHHEDLTEDYPDLRQMPVFQ